MRIDKYLSNLGFWSRKELKKYIKNEIVFLNDELVFDSNQKIEIWDKLKIWEFSVEYKEKVYLMLNKPKNYVSSNIDEAWYESCKNLLENCPYDEIVEIMWRLDVDTTGLIIMTTEWKIIHNVINSKKEIFKKYKVNLSEKIDNYGIKKLERWWIKIDNYLTKPAVVEKINDKEIFLSISEWKFHQIKKMIEKINNQVKNLHRVSIWEIELWELELWKWRYLNEKEIYYLENL